MKIERFEDIEAWKEARKLVNTVYGITNKGKFSTDFDLKNQIRRSSVSAMANISEGFDRRTDKEFIQFLVIARASVSETKSHLYVALDCGYIDKHLFDGTYEQATKVVNLIDGFIRYLKQTPVSRLRT